MTDEALAASAAGGDRYAFEQLVERHRAAVYRLARAMTANHADADDAAQETFIRIHRALGSYDPTRPFKAWMLRIARNTSLNVLRSTRPGRTVPIDEDMPEPPDPAPGPEEALRTRQAGASLSRALAALPEELRTVLVLRAQDGMSYREIAGVMGCRIGTVMSRLSRARERILKALDRC